MSPVADNLAQYLANTYPSLEETTDLLKFFGCLSRALSYIHHKGLRHRNIKPENILVSQNRIYLTDFESSYGWSKFTTSTPTTKDPTGFEGVCKT